MQDSTNAFHSGEKPVLLAGPWQHSLWGPAQNDKVVSLVQKQEKSATKSPKI